MTRLTWFAASTLLAGGCAMMLPTPVTVLRAPPIDGLQGRGCAVAVAPVELAGVLVDGRRWAGPEAARALGVFARRFADGVSNVDPRNLTAGASGPLVARPTLTRATRGALFVDAASTPTEVWVTLELTDGSGQVLEQLEAHLVVDANAQQPGFDDRLAQAGELAGARLGKFVRAQLKCR